MKYVKEKTDFFRIYLKGRYCSALVTKFKKEPDAIIESIRKVLLFSDNRADNKI